MISRSLSCYVELPNEMVEGKKKKEAKATISMNIVVPSYMEKKSQKFLSDAADDFSRSFKKFMKKQIEKYMKKLED